MKKGGYQIIDLKNIAFTNNVAMMVDGIYDLIEGSFRKSLLLSGLKYAGVEYGDAFVTATTNQTAYNIVVYGLTIKIENTDAVTITKN